MTRTLRLVVVLALSVLIAAPPAAFGASSAAGVGQRPALAGKAVRAPVTVSALSTRLRDSGRPRVRRAPRLRPAGLSQARAPLSQAERLLSNWLIRPIDGDTFAYGPQRIRIQGVDAPELTESGGFEASERLAAVLREGPVVVVPKAVDRYGRTVAQVLVNDRDVARLLWDEGYAP